MPRRSCFSDFRNITATYPKCGIVSLIGELFHKRGAKIILFCISSITCTFSVIHYLLTNNHKDIYKMKTSSK